MKEIKILIICHSRSPRETAGVYENSNENSRNNENSRSIILSKKQHIKCRTLKYLAMFVYYIETKHKRYNNTQCSGIQSQ